MTHSYSNLSVELFASSLSVQFSFKFKERLPLRAIIPGAFPLSDEMAHVDSVNFTNTMTN